MRFIVDNNLLAANWALTEMLMVLSVWKDYFLIIVSFRIVITAFIEVASTI